MDNNLTWILYAGGCAHGKFEQRIYEGNRLFQHNSKTSTNDLYIPNGLVEIQGKGKVRIYVIETTDSKYIRKSLEDLRRKYDFVDTNI